MRSAPNMELASERDALRADLYREQGGLCWLCQGPMVLTGRDGLNRPDACTIDHVKPKIHGGGNERSNLRAAHRRCNSTRGHMPPEHAQNLLRHDGPNRERRAQPSRAMPFTRQWLIDKGYIAQPPRQGANPAAHNE